MTPTSDERREVAATMRAISCRGVKNLTLGEVLNSTLTCGAPRPTTEMAILARLADLIDPTCTPVAHNYGSIVGNACPMCGWSVAGYMRYCPGCGARVVTADGRE